MNTRALQGIPIAILTIVLLSSCVGIQLPLSDHVTTGRRASRSYYLAGCRTWERNHPLALAYWEKAIAADPSFKKPLKTLAGAYFAPLLAQETDPQKKSALLAKSRYYAGRLITLDRNDPDGYFIMADAYMFDQKPKEAIPYFSQLLQFNVQNDSVYYKKSVAKNDVNYSLALCYGTLKDYKKSLYYLKRFVTVCSHDECYSGSIHGAQNLIPTIEHYLNNQKKIAAIKRRYAVSSPPSKPTKPRQKALPQQHTPRVSPPRVVPTQALPRLAQASLTQLENEQNKIDQKLSSHFDQLVFKEACKKSI